MNEENAIKWMQSGDHIYSTIKKPKVGYLGTPAFGTKLDPGVFDKLQKNRIIRLGMVIDGVAEFDLVSHTANKKLHP